MHHITQVISDSNIGGAGVLVCHICEALKREFDFTLMLPRGSALLSRVPSGVRIREVPMARDRSLRPSDISLFRRLFSEQEPDLVHTHAALSARIGARLCGIHPILSTRHCSIERSKSPSVLYRRVYNSVTDCTVSTADFAKKNLTDEGVPEEKIQVIKNGSPKAVRTDENERAACRHSLEIPNNSVVLGSVARLEIVKGQDLMIEAISRLHRLDGIPEVHLVLVGTGSAGASYKTLARELGVSQYVHFVGYSATPHLYQNIFDINLNASRGTETSCLATSECMSLGIPTVASDFGGNPEMICDGINGLLFPKESVSGLVDAVGVLLGDPLLYLTLCEGAERSYCEKFSIERMASAYRELYNRLLFV